MTDAPKAPGVGEQLLTKPQEQKLEPKTSKHAPEVFASAAKRKKRVRQMRTRLALRGVQLLAVLDRLQIERPSGRTIGAVLPTLLAYAQESDENTNKVLGAMKDIAALKVPPTGGKVVPQKAPPQLIPGIPEDLQLSARTSAVGRAFLSAVSAAVRGGINVLDAVARANIIKFFLPHQGGVVRAAATAALKGGTKEFKQWLIQTTESNIGPSLIKTAYFIANALEFGKSREPGGGGGLRGPSTKQKSFIELKKKVQEAENEFKAGIDTMKHELIKKEQEMREENRKAYQERAQDAIHKYYDAKREADTLRESSFFPPPFGQSDEYWDAKEKQDERWKEYTDIRDNMQRYVDPLILQNEDAKELNEAYIFAVNEQEKFQKEFDEAINSPDFVKGSIEYNTLYTRKQEFEDATFKAYTALTEATPLQRFDIRGSAVIGTDAEMTEYEELEMRREEKLHHARTTEEEVKRRIDEENKARQDAKPTTADDGQVPDDHVGGKEGMDDDPGHATAGGGAPKAGNPNFKLENEPPVDTSGDATPPDDLRILKLINQGRALGLPLPQIAKMIGLTVAQIEERLGLAPSALEQLITPPAATLSGELAREEEEFVGFQVQDPFVFDAPMAIAPQIKQVPVQQMVPVKSHGFYGQNEW